MELTRRELFAAVAATGIATVAHGAAPPAAAAARRELAPLPFDPKKLTGLSERLLVSHHDNNYAGAFKNLAKVEDELSRVTKDTPSFLVAGLRERELTFFNSVVLHELYFSNLGGDGKPAGTISTAIGGAFGTLARWEELFRATAMGLAGGSGWVALDLSLYTGELRIVSAGNHTQTLALGAPVLVLDMYEHAYALDYGAAAAKYIDAFFANVRWDEVDRRHARAKKALAAMRT